MNITRTRAGVMRAAAQQTTGGGAAFTLYFADQEPIDGRLTVDDLTATSCRWPTGNPRDLKTFRYCGATAEGGPYCERHAQLAYLSRAASAA